ncbi:hypothetical protein [Nocardia neocaledoniensis]|uniref:arsenate reductase/protein-tyrosine-phosphatase family protein n=1 Tax=Nocardia neocaledoniensis TaxID=236511 RepID=UPI0024581D67|nr:hypothetical protein [Nocardia neocaledoniensis]
MTAESAGTRALVGIPPETLASDVIVGLGADTAGFEARKLKPEMVDLADLVLVMSESLWGQVGKLAFGAASRTYILGEAHRIAKIIGAKFIAALHRPVTIWPTSAGRTSPTPSASLPCVPRSWRPHRRIAVPGAVCAVPVRSAQVLRGRQVPA